jgi:hypothetical protein
MRADKDRERHAQWSRYLPLSAGVLGVGLEGTGMVLPGVAAVPGLVGAGPSRVGVDDGEFERSHPTMPTEQMEASATKIVHRSVRISYSSDSGGSFPAPVGSFRLATDVPTGSSDMTIQVIVQRCICMICSTGIVL